MLAAVPERPKIADAPLSVVLLARAGGAELEATVHAWRAWLNTRPGEAEVLVVIPERASANCIGPLGDPRVRIVHHVTPTGSGACLQTAVLLARHPLLLTTTADRQFQPADAEGLFARIDQVDVVGGWRVESPPPLWLRALGLIKRLLTRVLLGYADEPRVSWLGWRGLGRRCRIRHIFGVKLHDAECVFRLYRADVLRRFPIQSNGSFAHVEVLAKANHLGCWMAETPVPWTPPAQEEPDPLWAADAKLVRRRPDFGASAECAATEL